MDKVVVLWTANTERYSSVIEGLNDTVENLLGSVDKNETEISPSTLYAIACVLENVPFINGSPQNTFVPGRTASKLHPLLCFLHTSSINKYCNLIVNDYWV